MGSASNSVDGRDPVNMVPYGWHGMRLYKHIDPVRHPLRFVWFMILCIGAYLAAKAAHGCGWPPNEWDPAECVPLMMLSTLEFVAILAVVLLGDAVGAGYSRQQS